MTAKKAKRSRKLWTPEEEEILFNMLGEAQLHTIAKTLGRSVCSVINRVKLRKNINMVENSGALKTFQLADVLGVDQSSIIYWIKYKDLVAHRFYRSSSTDKSKRHHYVFPDDFWKWAKKNKSSVNFKKMKRGVLIPEPDWLEEAIENETKTDRFRAPWTINEDKMIWDLIVKKRLTYSDVSKATGRTPKSVQKRFLRLEKELPSYLD